MGVCAKCGEPFLFEDIILVDRGRETHYVFCPRDRRPLDLPAFWKP